MKKTFVNWALITIFVIGYPMIILIFSLVFFPLFHSPPWIVWGTLILGPLLTFITISLVSPLILIIHGDTATFIGLPWVFRIRRDKLARVMIINYGFAFIPKDSSDYRFVQKGEEDVVKGYKILKFWNLKAWGELILFLRPEQMMIDWPSLKDKEKNYILKKVGELGESNP